MDKLDMHLVSYIQPSGQLVRIAWGCCKDDWFCERRLWKCGHVQEGSYGGDREVTERTAQEWAAFEERIGSVRVE